MIYGYARVSTAGQAAHGNSLDDQKNALKSAGAQKIYSEHYTGTKMDRPQFTALTRKLQEGDTLVVTKLDRIARTATEGYEMIQSLLNRGVAVRVLNMGLIDNTPTGRLTLQIFLAFAQFERDMIVERTAAGKAVAKQTKPDYHEGRPQVHDHSDLARKIADGLSYTECGVSKATWYRVRRDLRNGRITPTPVEEANR